jgi:lysozyme
MITSNNGLALIKASESCSLTAYPDPASELGQACSHMGLKMTEYQQVPRWQLLKADPVTIGWGHTGLSCKLGNVIPQALANDILKMDVHFAEAPLFDLGLNQNQFDALVSLIFNIGARAFHASTLLVKLKARDYPGAADEFLKWDHAGGQVLPGLLNRRKAERALFLTPMAEEGAA